MNIEKYDCSLLESLMRLIITGLLIFMSGWTLASHFCTLMGLNLRALIFISLFSIPALLIFYIFLCKDKKKLSLSKL